MESAVSTTQAYVMNETRKSTTTAADNVIVPAEPAGSKEKAQRLMLSGRVWVRPEPQIGRAQPGDGQARGERCESDADALPEER